MPSYNSIDAHNLFSCFDPTGVAFIPCHLLYSFFCMITKDPNTASFILIKEMLVPIALEALYCGKHKCFLKTDLFESNINYSIMNTPLHCEAIILCLRYACTSHAMEHKLIGRLKEFFGAMYFQQNGTCSYQDMQISITDFCHYTSTKTEFYDIQTIILFEKEKAIALAMKARENIGVRKLKRTYL